MVFLLGFEKYLKLAITSPPSIVSDSKHEVQLISALYRFSIVTIFKDQPVIFSYPPSRKWLALATKGDKMKWKWDKNISEKTNLKY